MLNPNADIIEEAARITKECINRCYDRDESQREAARREDILLALQTIKDECERNKECETCAFFQPSYDSCFFKENCNTPADWKIANKEPVWRAV